ncbi:Mitochondrial acidic protein mam33 [Neolecta irregularis DAH-3]|uniref:Mitochondrial acidic protein mam33 n=1 Tax=Neolecta irregularis (strain DAH-3) TaxID=1198029 RepID=A0A1U7LJ58_NEOID|nr:Mitochondrial acidic protein mam33 [Neolecta irregularis DAH-3]|eukprot:OLL22679.1 Mitochondrial acidic protein mam33 [Neolecta irregularis DAH-3]
MPAQVNTSLGKILLKKVEAQLKSKLQSEISYEKQMRETLDELSGFEEFFKNSPFKIHDTEGHGVVTLTRQYGNENIKITFDISDLQSRGQDDDLDRFEDELEDEDEDEESKPARRPAQSDEESDEDEDENKNENENDDEDEDEESRSFPLHCSILVEKPNSGSLLFETTAHEGVFIIDSVSFMNPNKIAPYESAEGQYQRQVLYPGPDFRMIDQEIQTLFEGYLEVRGINTAMASFLPEYCVQKDQKEYLNWLKSVANFV